MGGDVGSGRISDQDDVIEVEEVLVFDLTKGHHAFFDLPELAGVADLRGPLVVDPDHRVALVGEGERVVSDSVFGPRDEGPAVDPDDGG